MKSKILMLFAVAAICFTACKKESKITADAADTISSNQNLRLDAPTGPVGVPILIAGKKNVAGFVNGAGANARFAGPGPIFVNADGTLLIGEETNGAIRKIASSTVSTVKTGNLFQLQDIAALNDGTIAANCLDYLMVYQKGQIEPEYYNNCSHCYLSGLDRDPAGNFFWYMEMTLTPTTTKSLLLSLNAAYERPKPSKEVSNLYRISSVTTPGPIRFFTTDDNRVLQQTAAGTIIEIVPGSFSKITDIVANKSGTKVYIADSGTIKVITLCPNCIPRKAPTVATLYLRANATGLALSNSESVLFFTSSKEHTVSKINLQ